MTRVIPALPVNSLAVSCQHLSDFPIQEFGIDSVSCHAELQPRHHSEGKGPPLRGPLKMDLQAGKGLWIIVDLQIKNVYFSCYHLKKMSVVVPRSYDSFNSNLLLMVDQGEMLILKNQRPAVFFDTQISRTCAWWGAWWRKATLV